MVGFLLLVVCDFTFCSMFIKFSCLISRAYVAGSCVVAKPAPHAGVGPPAPLAEAVVRPEGDFLMRKLV